jgi:hypothetical protein
MLVSYACSSYRACCRAFADDGEVRMRIGFGSWAERSDARLILIFAKGSGRYRRQDSAHGRQQSRNSHRRIPKLGLPLPIPSNLPLPGRFRSSSKYRRPRPGAKRAGPPRCDMQTREPAYEPYIMISVNRELCLKCLLLILSPAQR